MYYIGVDLGGTNIAIGIVNEEFEIVKKGSTPTKPERGADAIVADMAALSRKLLEEMGLTLDDVVSAGVATPGTANNETGVVEYANNIPFLQYPLAAKLSALLDNKPVYIENDANAAAKAEAMAGVAKGAPFSVMITTAPVSAAVSSSAARFTPASTSQVRNSATSSSKRTAVSAPAAERAAGKHTLPQPVSLT